MAGTKFLGFDHGKADQVTRLLWMPPVIHTVDANEKQSLEIILTVLGLGVEAWNMSLHEFTAWVLP
jgi:hypothetical protein